MVKQKLILPILLVLITDGMAIFYFNKDQKQQHGHEEVQHHNFHHYHYHHGNPGHVHHDEHKYHHHHHQEDHKKHQQDDHKHPQHKQEQQKPEHKHQEQKPQSMHKHQEQHHHHQHQHKHELEHKQQEEHKQPEHKYQEHKYHNHHHHHHHHHDHKHHDHSHDHHHKHQEHDHHHHKHQEHDHHHHKHQEHDHHHHHQHQHHDHKHHGHDHHDHCHHHHEHDHKHEGPPYYVFRYGVRDPHTGDMKNQWEMRKGDVVEGEYSMMEPDGTIRTVKYTAGKDTGFNAVVKTEGKTKQPVRNEQRIVSRPTTQKPEVIKPVYQDQEPFEPIVTGSRVHPNPGASHLPYYFSYVPINHKPVFSSIDEETNLLALYKRYPIHNFNGNEERGFGYGISEYLTKRSYDMNKITDLLNSSPRVDPIRAARGSFAMG